MERNSMGAFRSDGTEIPEWNHYERLFADLITLQYNEIVWCITALNPACGSAFFDMLRLKISNMYARRQLIGYLIDEDKVGASTVEQRIRFACAAE